MKTPALNKQERTIETLRKELKDLEKHLSYLNKVYNYLRRDKLTKEFKNHIENLPKSLNKIGTSHQTIRIRKSKIESLRKKFKINKIDEIERSTKDSKEYAKRISSFLYLFFESEKYNTLKQENRLKRHFKYNTEYIKPSSTLPDNSENRSTLPTNTYTFVAYYFHIPKPKIEVIGSGGLELKGNDKNGFATFKIATSISDPASEKIFTGPYTKQYDKQYFINLSLESTKETLPIKFYSSNLSKNRELYLGAYISAIPKKINAGTILFLSTPKDLGNIEPILQSSTINSSNFKNIPETIRRYFSIKRYNYLKIKSDARTIDKINEFISSESMKTGKNLFITPPKPIVYIAHPNKSIDSRTFKNHGTTVAKLAKEISDELQNKVQIELHDKQKVNDSKDLAKVSPSLDILQKTSLFVLFYTHTASASFSLVQLGWALGKSKNILIYSKSDQISENTRRIDNYPNADVKSYYNLENEFDKIKSEIKIAIEKAIRN